MSNFPSPGQPAPAVALPGSDEATVSLQARSGPQGLALLFLHGTWCPVCVQQMVQFQRRYAAFQEKGVNLAVVARDNLDAARAYALSSDPPLPFPILADEQLQAARAFGMINESGTD